MSKNKLIPKNQQGARLKYVDQSYEIDIPKNYLNME